MWISALILQALAFSSLRSDTTTGITGGSAPFDNRQPTRATRYIIALQGIFPDNNGGIPQAVARDTPYVGEIKAVAFDFAPQGWALCEGQSIQTNQNTALFSLLGYRFGGEGSNFNLPDLRGRVPIGQGQGAGLANYVNGQAIGTAQPSLSVGNLPAHAHALASGQTAAEGSGEAVNNIQPSLVLNFLVNASGEIMIAGFERQPQGWALCDGRLLSTTGNTTLFNLIGTTYGGDGDTNFALPDLRGRGVVNEEERDGFSRGFFFGNESFTLTESQMCAHIHSLLSGGNTASTGGAASVDNSQPSLVLKWLISFVGSFPSPTSSINWPAIGEMRIIAGASAPDLLPADWKPLDDTIYAAAESRLIELVGDTYGGDGSNNFGVPDLRARFNVSVDRDTLLLGDSAGEDFVTLSMSNLAAHAHDLPAEIGVEQPAGTLLADGLDSINFGSTSGGGTVVRMFTIRNSGVGDLLVGTVTTGGAHPGDFTIEQPDASTLPPNSSTTFAVAFSPQGAGTRTATLHVPSNDGDEAPFDVNLIGFQYSNVQTWRILHFGSPDNRDDGADDNDFEGDGLRNDLEFTTGNDPTRSDPATGQLTLSGAYMEFRYQLAKAALDDGYSSYPEWVADIERPEWTDRGVVDELVDEDDTFEYRLATVEMPPDTGDGVRGFMRLRVTPPAVP